MKKKVLELEKARILRKQGESIGSIASRLNVSKGSVSIWVRDINLNKHTKENLIKNMHSKTAIKKRVASRLKSEKIKRDKTITEAKEEIKTVNYRELWYIGTVLYWAEGGKTQRMVRFSNGDPDMIKLMIKYFTEICKVHKSKIRGYIHIHDGLDIEKSEKYWQRVSSLPQNQFYKTYVVKNGKSKRKTLPYGVMDIYILDVKLFLKIQGWIRGISNKATKD